MSKRISRRRFLQASAASGALLTSIPFVWSETTEKPTTSAAEKINVAFIGVEGRGTDNIKTFAQMPDVNVVALCDVDSNKVGNRGKEYPKAKTYGDFRKLLEQKDIDAVVISIPDHQHAVAAMATMQLGKNLYCEKPLTHDIYEARMLTEAARKYKVATQMGNHGHASDGLREQVDWIRAGVIGPVKEVHVWTNRPIWPQGMERPQGSDPIPPNLNWDLWLGTAPQRPYKGKRTGESGRGAEWYQPFVWRGWWDFGTGALGDMACHIMDPAYWALDLGQPIAVEATSEGATSESAPHWSIIRYDFPARGNMPACRMTWYDGGKIPDVVRDLQKAADEAASTQPTDAEKKAVREAKFPFKPDGGLLFVGEKGKMLAPYQKSPSLVNPPANFQPPPPVLPRIKGDGNSHVHHVREFLEAAKGGPAALSNFDYAGPLTETVLLGNLAVRTDKRVEWDAANMRSTNVPEANQYVKREYRDGWSL